MTGTLEYFASVMSARTVVGHDREGRVIFMQADGKTGENGSVVCQQTVRHRYSDRSANYMYRHHYKTNTVY